MTLETAKQLKSAGWDKETEKTICPIGWEGGTEEQYPCPSLEELLAVMPTVYRGGKKDHCFHLRKLNGVVKGKMSG